MEIIKPREHHTEVGYSLEYDYVDRPGSGFSFECDEHGQVDESSFAPEGLENFRKCQAGLLNVGPARLRRNERSWWEPAVGRCNHCGEEVILDRFTCTCECGVDYNGFGQELAPRSQWGEETGEYLGDILRIP
jgi:hypothetical protein